MTDASQKQPEQIRFHVLYADDDPLGQASIEKALKARGHACTLVNTGRACLDRALESPPDLILLGVDMPDMGGMETCEHLRHHEVLQNVPVILLSVDDALENRLAGYAAGGDDYVGKPFEVAELIARINATIKRHRSLDEIRRRASSSLLTTDGLMKSLGEASVIIHFLQSISTCKHHETLARHIIQTHSGLGLDISTELRVNGEAHHYCTGGIVHPLEKSVFTYVASKGRLVDFNERTVVNFPNISILIRNMPLHDNIRYGRIRDYIAIIGQAADSKIADIESAATMREQYEGLLRISDNTKQTMEELKKAQRRYTESGEDILSSLAGSVDESIVLLGMTEAQEDYLVSEIETAQQRMRGLAVFGARLDERLGTILTGLETTLANFSPPEETQDASSEDEAVTFF